MPSMTDGPEPQEEQVALPYDLLDEVDALEGGARFGHRHLRVQRLELFFLGGGKGGAVGVGKRAIGTAASTTFSTAQTKEGSSHRMKQASKQASNPPTKQPTNHPSNPDTHACLPACLPACPPPSTHPRTSTPTYIHTYPLADMAKNREEFIDDGVHHGVGEEARPVEADLGADVPVVVGVKCWGWAAGVGLVCVCVA